MAEVTDDDKQTTKPLPCWVPDTRTVIVAWMMASSFVIIVLCWWKPPSADSQLLNTLIGMYVGTGFITAITWWMGSAKGSDSNNKMADANTRMVDKLTAAAVVASPAAIPAPPVSTTTTVTDNATVTKTEPTPAGSKS